MASPVFLGCALVLAIIYAQLILFNVVGPFLIQTVLGESPIVFGRVALSLGIAWFLGSLANRILTATFPQLPLMEIATAVAFVGSTIMAWLAFESPLSLSNLVIPTAVVFMSGSITFTRCFGLSIRLFPEQAGTASALVGTLFIAGSALAGFGASFLEAAHGHPARFVLRWTHRPYRNRGTNSQAIRAFHTLKQNTNELNHGRAR